MHTLKSQAGDDAADWRAFDWGTLTAANVAAILAKVTGAPATMNKTRAVLRGIARAAWRLRRIDSEELARIEDIRPVLEAVSLPAVRWMAGSCPP